MGQVFAYLNHKNGVLDDSALEFVNAAAKIGGDSVIAVLTGSGADLDTACSEAASLYTEVYKIDNEALAYPNAEVVRKALLNVIPADAIVLAAHDTFGMDLSPGYSVKADSAFAADVVGIEGTDGDTLKVIRQEFGGVFSTHVDCDISTGAILNIRPGAFAPEESKSAEGTVTDKSGDAGDLSSKRKFLEVVEAEMGDVDITKSEVLVSIGRGIEDEENIEMAQDLAEAMGADMSCSRPIVDAKWLEKARQVGTSGQTVKPKVYLAMGISGSFQHMGGIKGNPFVIAVNKNETAPIFQVADVGIVEDILDFIPELSDAIKDL